MFIRPKVRPCKFLRNFSTTFVKLREETGMDYRRIDNHKIEIIPGQTPIDKLLETMARVSYESAKPPGSDFLKLLDKNSPKINFAGFVHLNSAEVLDIDYVNQRQCKTKVRKTGDGRFVFDARLYEMNGGSPELFLNKVKSALGKNAQGSKTSAQSDKAKPWSRNNQQRSRWLEFLLEIIDLFT